MDSEKTFVALHRSHALHELLSDPKRHKDFAFLALIAIRARYTDDGVNVDGLEKGECLLGDHDSCGMTRGEYRRALQRWTKRGVIAVKATNKGTIVKLLKNPFFSVSAPSKKDGTTTETTIERPSNDQQGATNNKDTRKQGNKSSLLKVQRRLNPLFRRKDTTAWDKKEVASLKQLLKEHGDPPEGIDGIVELYSATNPEDSEENCPLRYRRKKLLTLLNNWAGEIDRYHEWQEWQSRKPPLAGARSTIDPDAYRKKHPPLMVELMKQNAKATPKP